MSSSAPTPSTTTDTGTTTYENVVSGAKKGSLQLTASHFLFKYEVVAEAEKEDKQNGGGGSPEKEKETKTMKLPWSKVSKHQITPATFSSHKLKVITGAAGQTSKTFEFTNRESLVTIHKDIQTRLRTSAPNYNAPVDQYPNKDSAQAENTIDSATDTSKQPPPKKGAKKSSENSKPQEQQSAVDEQGKKSSSAYKNPTATNESKEPVPGKTSNTASQLNNQQTSSSKNPSASAASAAGEDTDSISKARIKAMNLALIPSTKTITNGDPAAAVVEDDQSDIPAKLKQPASRAAAQSGAPPRNNNNNNNNNHNKTRKSARGRTRRRSPNSTPTASEELNTRKPITKNTASASSDTSSFDIMAVVKERQQHELETATGTTTKGSFRKAIPESGCDDNNDDPPASATTTEEAVEPSVALQRNGITRPSPRPGAVAITPSPSLSPTTTNHEEAASSAELQLLQQSTTNDLGSSPNPPSDFLVQATLVEDYDGTSNNNRPFVMTPSQRLQVEEETRRRMMNEMIVVDAGTAIPMTMTTTDSEETEIIRKKYRRRILIILTLAFLFSCAVILGSVLLTRRQQQQQNSSTSPTINTGDAAMVVLSSVPSTSPTISFSSTSVDTTTTSTTPTNIPCTTNNPSSFPTLAPDNRFCGQAHELFVGDSIFVQDLREGDDDSNVWQDGVYVPDASLGAGGGNLGIVEVCHSGLPDAIPAARWYRMTGVGPVTVTTCDERTTVDTDIQVYIDPQNCPFPQTCASNLNYNITASSLGCTTVSWMSIINAEYLILVSEAFEQFSSVSGGVGAGGDDGGGSVAIRLVNNDLCQYAYRPVAPPWPKQSYLGSLTGTTSDATATLSSSCGQATIPQQAGIWYEIDGIDGVIMADTCVATLIDTQISIYKGSCDQLECVDGNDAACGETALQSAVSWNAQQGETYYILVHGGKGVSSGSFTLSIQALLVPNDKCSNAVALNLAGAELVVPVPLASATVDPETIPSFFECLIYYDPNGDASRGVWYSFLGTGATYSIEVQGGSNPYVVLYEGNCDNLQCSSEALYDALGYGLSWTTEEDKNYLIYVFYTQNAGSGDAEMMLKELYP